MALELLREHSLGVPESPLDPVIVPALGVAQEFQLEQDLRMKWSPCSDIGYHCSLPDFVSRGWSETLFDWISELVRPHYLIQYDLP